MAGNITYKDFSDEKNYTAMSADVMSVRARGDVPLACIRTYGCQQNVADSEKIKGMLSDMGFDFTEKTDAEAAQ